MMPIETICMFDHSNIEYEIIYNPHIAYIEKESKVMEDKLCLILNDLTQGSSNVCFQRKSCYMNICLNVQTC